jgi:hypothetical protein
MLRSARWNVLFLLASTRQNLRVRHWAGVYEMSGQLAVTWSRRTFPVALPDRTTIGTELRPEWEEPNPKATVRIFGRTEPTRTPQPASPGEPRRARAYTTPLPIRVPDLLGLAWSCPGVGWHFHLDSIEQPALKRIYITVPHGRSNGTGGLVLDRTVPWPGPPPGHTVTTTAHSGKEFRFDLTVRTMHDRRWQWDVSPLWGFKSTLTSRLATPPWIESFQLDIEADIDDAPTQMRVRFKSDTIRHPALQADVLLTRKAPPVQEPSG